MILQWIRNRMEVLRRERIYIVPSWKAFIWTILLFGLLGFSVVLAKPEWIVFPFVLFLVMLIMMFQSNRNLSKLVFTFEPKTCLEENKRSIISINVRNVSNLDKFSIYLRLKSKSSKKKINQVFFLSKILANQQTKCNLEMNVSDPGIESSLTLELWSYAPIGMFYSWRNILVEDSIYVIPRIMELSEPLVSATTESLEKVRENTTPPVATFKSGDEFLEYVPLQENSREAFDWKVFAKNRRYVKKSFEEISPDSLNANRKVFIDLDSYLLNLGMELNSIRYFVGDVNRALRSGYQTLVKIKEEFFLVDRIEDKNFQVALASVCEDYKRGKTSP